MGKLYMEEKINECICVSDERPKLKNCLDDHRIGSTNSDMKIPKINQTVTH